LLEDLDDSAGADNDGTAVPFNATFLELGSEQIALGGNPNFVALQAP
jgi:hypothetical protein